ncbi:hypothetical protein [Streptomyces sp. H27-D2]|nr:hypothetical protein [Streptomyces sp. H27-D2]MEC4020525.1 hypothetical protein [Streptomyces sp. H27-D2]
MPATDQGVVLRTYDYSSSDERSIGSGEGSALRQQWYHTGLCIQWTFE